MRLGTRAAEVLPDPSRMEKPARRVADLAGSRAGVLDTADAEGRRIERDLHDGAQQRPVSLTVNLGLARSTPGDLQEDARKVIDEAHREAKEAIAELNNPVCGLHRPSLRTAASTPRCPGSPPAPVPVHVAVDLPQRPSPTVEAVAYFREKNSVATASHESFGGWTKCFTDPRLCAAVVDRLTFGGNIVETGTDSYRLASTRAGAAEKGAAMN
ncbi:histidine kinase [Streptomyces longisporus]|uniref:Uncharacterized protein n=1 Tax=Streptomyces longisporus TaxID=1948 RepID=A0ABN3NHR9_STRLO